MPTTQLFVELLVIGYGATAWLVLLVAAALGWQPTQISPQLAGEALVPLTALSYVLGIILDRVAREFFEKVLPKATAPAEGISLEDAEHSICEKSERLWSSCVYNRSRFRICRAWTLSFAMIGIAYSTWRIRIDMLAWSQSAEILVLAFLCSLLAAWATVHLHRDYYTQVGKLFRFLRTL